MLILFKTKDTFLLLPAIGFVRDRGSIYFTFGIAGLGLSFRIYKAKKQRVKNGGN